MIDVKNLNRVKGILSAKQGAEIPKYITGGPFTYTVRAGDTLSQIVASYNSQNDTKLKWKDVASWNNIVNPHQIKVGQVIKFKDPAIGSTAEIPGDPKLTPTTAVETSALANEAVDAQKQQLITEQTAAQQYNKAQPELLKTSEGLNINPDEQLKKTSKNTSSVETGNDKDNTDKEKRKKQARDAVGYATTAAIQGIGNVVGAKQAATDSNLTKGIDNVYNATAQGLQNAGGVAGVVGTAMQFAGIAGDIIQELGGGTDQQTSVDKWMDSPLLSWWLGAANGFAGKNTQDFSADQSIISQVGGSYGGFVDSITDSAAKAGKKYGLFSTAARIKTDAAIDKARLKQNRLGTIANDVSDQRLAAQSMGEQAGLAYSIMTNGGYDQKYTYSAKRGGVLKETSGIEFNLESSIALEWEPQVEINWELPIFKEGGNIASEWIPTLQSGNKVEKEYPQEYIDFIDSVAKHAPNLRAYSPEGYRMFRFWQLRGKPKNWEEAMQQEMFILQDDGSYHAPSIAWNENGEGEWLKHTSFPTAWMEKAFYDGYDFERDPETGEPIFSDSNPLYEGVRPKLIPLTGQDAEESRQLRENYTIVEGPDGYRKYVPKQYKKGGSLGDSDVPEIEETTQKNVIPEGALHKNKHHMEHAEGLTKKGIPVIDDDGDQQAEIEHSEIIFTLEVTKKLEEYYETFYSDESSNKEKEQAALDAGKLLVYQILENTEDRTGLIESCKNGGTLNKKDSRTSTLSDKDLMKEALKSALLELLTK